MSAGLAARVLASAVLVDYRLKVLERLAGGPEPDWASWAHRLAGALGDVLDVLNVLVAWDLTLRQALRDAIRYQENLGSEPGSDATDQIALYRLLARDLGIEVGL